MLQMYCMCVNVYKCYLELGGPISLILVSYFVEPVSFDNGICSNSTVPRCFYHMKKHRLSTGEIENVCACVYESLLKAIHASHTLHVYFIYTEGEEKQTLPPQLPPPPQPPPSLPRCFREKYSRALSRNIHK